MGGPKDPQFQQFGRVSSTGVIPAPSPDDDGREILVDPNGRVWVRPFFLGPSGDLPFTGAGQDYVHDLQQVVQSPLSIQQYALDRALAGAAVDLTAKPKPGRLYGAFAATTSAMAEWLQVHNTVGTPVLGAIPEMVLGRFTDAGNDKAWRLDLQPFGVYLSIGITIAISIQPEIFDPPAQDAHISILYR